MGGCKVKSIHSKIHVLKLNPTVSKMIQFYCRYPKIFCLDSVLQKNQAGWPLRKKAYRIKAVKELKWQ